MQVLLPEQNLSPTTTVVVGDKLKVVDEIQSLLEAAKVGSTSLPHDGNKENVEEQKSDNKTRHAAKFDDNNNNSDTSNLNVGDKAVGSSLDTPIHTHTPFPGISQLTTNLYLCGAGVVMPMILDQLQVRFIINVAPELPDTPLSSVTKPLYLRINAYDRPNTDLSVHFDEVADMIEEVRQLGGKSLVHCVAGVSRSATLCLAYLMKYGGMSLRAAYLHVKAIRPQIRPNTGFFQQLRCYEEQLRGSCSVQMVYYESLNREIPDVYEPEYRAMEEFYQRQRKALKRH
ncbi:PREDICTED: dual specificity protein phosphatase 18 [Bactrocera latifrons]|uniref:Dual specificity protein phosphatase 18 n=2 Tax=Bactrocera latifrons TaxID=174628 RepID=A0A0K8VBP4_BACLA|nr:PREDICTED: dual specificity protein phosphatase 18 [Bactrocera latifrons]